MLTMDLSESVSMKQTHLPEVLDKIPCFITKALSCDKFSLQLNCNKMEYIDFINKLIAYFYEKSDIETIDKFADNESIIMGSVFVLKRDDLYYRVQVKEILSNNRYLVYLLDEGFSCIASESDLIFNDNFEFNKFPKQAFTFSLKLDYTVKNDLMFVLNYAFQLLVNNYEDFFVSLSSEGSKYAKLFFKYEDEIFSCDDFLNNLYNFIKNESLLIELDQIVQRYFTTFKQPVNLPTDSEQSPSDDNYAHLIKQSSLIDREKLNMECECILNPNEFYLKLPNAKELVTLEYEMQEYYAENSPTKASDVLLSNLYAVKFEDKWIRVFVKEEKLPNYLYSCFLMDKGLSGIVNFDELFELDKRFKKLPAQSFCASLSGIKPINDTWSIESIEIFKENLQDKSVTVYPEYFQDDNVLYCNLITSQCNISEILVTHGYAQLEQ